MIVFPEYTIIRDLSLTFRFVTTYFALHLAIYFLRQWSKKTVKRITDIKFGWAIFLIMSSVANMAFMLSDFYMQGDAELFWLRVGYIFTLIGLAVFANIEERVFIARTYNMFTVLFIIGAIVSIFLPYTIMRYLAYFFYTPLAILLFAAFSIVALKNCGDLYRKHVSSFILGFIFVILGNELTTLIVMELFGELPYAIGLILMTFGFLVMSIAITRIPSFDELSWFKYIKEIYLMSEHGDLILHQIIQPEYIKYEVKTEEELPEPVVGKMFYGLLNLIKEIIKREGFVRVIEKEDLKILFGYKKPVYLIVIALENLEIVHQKIDEFLDEFLTIYGESLLDLKDSSELLDSVKRLVIKTFTEKQ